MGFPAAIRIAVEPRHSSWWTDETREVLAARNAALCWADRKGTALTPLWRTADWGYLRLHEGDAASWPRYTPETLGAWAERLSMTWSDAETVYVYFNNDQRCAAPHDADALAGSVKQQGRTGR